MFPNFLIVGAQKAASSWLGDMLSQHPDVYVYRRGEIHFFDAHFHKGPEWYRGHFGEWAGENAVGEKTPQYLSHPLAAERIRSVLGDEVRLIMSLRHPVDRAYSAFWHGMKRGRIRRTKDFADAFAQRENLRRESAYGEHLDRLLHHFPRKQLLVLIFEEVMNDRAGALERCYEFLGVDTTFVPQEPQRRVNQSRDVVLWTAHVHALRRALRRVPRFVQDPLVRGGRALFPFLPRRRPYVPLLPDVRQDLLSHFADDIERLERTLGRDLSIWRSEPDDGDGGRGGAGSQADSGTMTTDGGAAGGAG